MHTELILHVHYVSIVVVAPAESLSTKNGLVIQYDTFQMAKKQTVQLKITIW